MAKIHGEEFPDLLVDSVTIDDSDLTSEYCRLPSDMAYFARRLAETEETFLCRKAELTQAQSEGYVAEVRLAASNGKKKPSDVLIQASVECLETVRQAHWALADAARERKELQGILDAISAKRDMLVQLGAARRQEMKAGIA